MLALLNVIDNPRQDIPLVAVLRSPIVGLNENELALLRINDRSGDYYQALLKFYEESPGQNQELHDKVKKFMEMLEITVEELTKCYLGAFGENKELSYGRCAGTKSFNELYDGLKPL